MKKNLLILFFLPLFFSCVVSKKKYEELEYAKRRSDAKVVVLNKKVDNKDKKIKSLDQKVSSLHAEFNDMKNNMSESNAMKSTEIDALSSRVDGLSNNSAEMTQKLASEQLKVSRYETQKLSYENKIAMLRAKIFEANENTVLKERDVLEKANAIVHMKNKYEISLKEQEYKLIQAKRELVDLKTKIKRQQDKNLNLARIIASNEAEIQKLNNQVKLYKGAK